MTTLQDVIDSLSLGTSLNVCWDVSDPASVASDTTQTIEDTSGNGNDYTRGFSTANGTADPTIFDGEYLEFDGGSLLREASAHTYAESWHKNNATFSAIFLCSILSGDHATALWSNVQAFSTPGVQIGVSGQNKPQIQVFTATNYASAVTSTIIAPEGEWCIIAFSMNEATGALKYRVNSNSESVTGVTYVTPSSSASGRDYGFGANSITSSSANGFLTDGCKIAAAALWSRALSDTELEDLYDALVHRLSITEEAVAEVSGSASLFADGIALRGAEVSIGGSGFLFVDVNTKYAVASLMGTASIEAISDARIFAATTDYTSLPTDDISNKMFIGTIRQALRFERSIIAGGVTVGFGELTLDNTEADYDYLIGNYTIDGREIVVKYGDKDGAYNDFIEIFRGTARGWHVAEDVLRIVIRDLGYKLEVPVSPNVYDGSGGVDGTSELTGKRKPRAFGRVLNVTPAFVIPTSRLWQVNDGPIEAIDNVYVRAAALSFGSDHATSALLIAASIADGEFDTCLAEGLFRIAYASGSEAGQVTADVRGDKLGGVYVNTVGTIVRRIVTSTAGIEDPTGLDTTSFSDVDTAQGSEVGIYIELDDSREVADVVSDLMGSVGGWGGFKRDGKFEVGIFTMPTGTPAAEFDRIDIINDRIERLQLPSEIDPPPYRYRVSYQRNYTVQESDIAGSVTESRRQFLKEQVRVADVTDALIRINHLLAQDPGIIQAYFADHADAEDEASRLIALYGTQRSLYRIVLHTQPFRLDVGDVIKVTYPRWDLAAGKLLKIVALVEDSETDTVEIQGLG